MFKQVQPVLIFALLFFLLGARSAATAAIAPLSQTQLKEKAEDIFVGKVLSISDIAEPSKRFDKGTKFTDRTYTITIGVITVLKYKSVKVATEVTVKAWQPVGSEQTGLIGFVGPQGHVPIPKKGDIITVYTEKSETNKDADEKTDAGKTQVYIPLLPNGMVIQKEETKEETSAPGTQQDGTTTLQTLSNATSFQFMATVALYKEMLLNTWDEKTYRQFAYYHGLNQVTLSELATTNENHKIWGPWFKEKLAYQASVFKTLQTYIGKKRKGDPMTPQDIAELTRIQRETTAKLGR